MPAGALETTDPARGALDDAAERHCAWLCLCARSLTEAAQRLEEEVTALSEHDFPMSDMPAPSDLSRIAAAPSLDEAADTAEILTAINEQSEPDRAR